MTVLVDLAPAALVGLAVGLAVGYLYFRQHVSPGAVAAARDEAAVRRTALEADLAAADAQAMTLRETAERAAAHVASLTERVTDLTAAEARLSSELTHHRRTEEERLARREADRLAAQREFERATSQMLKSGGEALRAEHARTLRELLDPVRVKLKEFEEQVDRKFSEESKDKAALKTQIEQLTGLNQRLAGEARHLAEALKGDSKVQGDWGELQLERLLEAAGLSAGTHFDLQASFRAEDGALQRPDCLVYLPQDRCLVVDSKVSLTAYERFCASPDAADAAAELHRHVLSVRNHIKGLSAKRYHELYRVNCPDYVLLFVPLEPAFIAAVRERPTLFAEALAANVVLVSPSTLLATMRTVGYIWQQDDQRENAAQIAEVGRKLYDKFAGFVDDMNDVGQQLTRAQSSYDAAMNKLSRSPKQSTTLLARANELRRLGVAGKKEIEAG